MHVFAVFDLHGDNEIVMKMGATGHQYLVGAAILGAFFIAAGEENPICKVYVASVHARRCPAGHGDRMLLADDWRELASSSRTCFFPCVAPSVAASTSSTPVLGVGVTAALKSLQEPSTSRRSSSSKHRGRAVRLVMPVGPADVRPDGGRGDDGSEDGSDPGSHHSAESASDPDVGAFLALARRMVGRQPAEAPAEHTDRKHPWGPWSISEIWAKTEFVGWGANCNCHFARNGLACKKPFNKTRLISLDECRLQAKGWLLMGVDIAAGRPEGRTDHVHGIKRADVHVFDEDGMDAMAASML